ncbi:hypothetical protein FRC12_014854 [Ceratobasidium sp. 428]|nr:hypothetical protein FRC12_014854 [Ceratobasidium sp. 428]
MPRVHTIDLTLRVNSQFLLDSLLACWVMYGSNSSPKCLKISNQSRLEVQIRASAQTVLEEQISTAQLDNFFEPIQTLALENCCASPDSGLYKGLTHLRLAGLYGDLTPLNVSQIIAASPCLRSLAIHDNVLFRQHEPVWVNSLELLVLSRLRVRGGLKNLLPWLNSKSSAISVTMRIAKDPDFVSESQDFFRRSSVTQLHVYSPHIYRFTNVAQLCPTANLQELIVENCDVRIDQQNMSLTSMVDENRYTRTPWPWLHTLYFLGCTVTLELLQQLLALHPIRRLRIYYCFLIVTDWPAPDCARLEKELSTTGIDVKCLSYRPADCPTRIHFREDDMPAVDSIDDYISTM